MPRGPSPSWKRRLEPIMDEYVLASIQHAGGIHDEQGHYAKLVYAGCEDYDRAMEIKRGFFRSRSYVKHNGKAISIWAEIVKAEDGTYQVHFKAIDRAHAKSYITTKAGGDRSKLAYDPYKRESKKK